MSRFDVRREAELKQLRTLGPLVAASLCERRVRCGNPTCKCARGEKHSSWCLTYKHKNRTRTVHVPRARLQEVEQWAKEYRRAKQLLKEISYQSMQIIQHHVQERRAAARVNAKP